VSELMDIDQSIQLTKERKKSYELIVISHIIYIYIYIYIYEVDFNFS